MPLPGLIRRINTKPGLPDRPACSWGSCWSSFGDMLGMLEYSQPPNMSVHIPPWRLRVVSVSQACVMCRFLSTTPTVCHACTAIQHVLLVGLLSPVSGRCVAPLPSICSTELAAGFSW